MNSIISPLRFGLFFSAYSVLAILVSSWNSESSSSTTTGPQVCNFAYKTRHNGSLPLSHRCKTCLSQRNQDHIIAHIFSLIGTNNRYCVEFGFGYGDIAKSLKMRNFLQPKGIISGLNTHRLIQQGWTPSFFDAQFENSNIRLFKAVLNRDNIGAHFTAAKIPNDVDYVSIDVDSVEVWLLLGLLESGFRPRLISLEFNTAWKAHMPVTCNDQWAPWKKRSRIYGSSAAAINIVAEKFGYKMVEMMRNLDLFLVRKSILAEKCSNVNQLPSFYDLADGILGWPHHVDCDINEARNRFVDFPLAYQGKMTQATEKAMEYIAELNRDLRTSNKSVGVFCPN